MQQKDILREQWKHFKSELNDYWTQLTSDDLDQVAGRRDNLVHLLEHRYGYTRPRAEKEVELFVTEFEDKLRRAS